MDSDSRFWVFTWAIIGVVTCSLFGLAGTLAVNANRTYYAAQSECLQQSGDWIPMTNYSAICLKRVKP